MTEKKFEGAPFGTQTARFDVSAVHPANKRVGTYIQIPYCKKRTSDLERNLGPGTYNDDRGDFSAQAVAKRAEGPGWHRTLETAKEARLPHLYREAWTNKHFLKTKVGPGTYESTDFIRELGKKPGSVRGVCDSVAKRFRDVQSCTPGPGCYGKGGVPWAASDEKRVHSAGCIKMEHSTRETRFPLSPAVGCGPDPGAYTLKSSVDVLLSRRVSNRGPYDLFTGPRDGPATSGYFATQQQRRVGPCPGQYSVDGFGDELRRKEKHGVFSRSEQHPSRPTERIYHSTLAQCPHPLTSLGPGTYEVTASTRPVSHNQPPFLSSAPRNTYGQVGQPARNHITVGPGRYDIEPKGPKKYPKGPTAVFKSQTQRYSHLRDKHMQERLRAVNVPMDRRGFLLGNGQSGRNLLVESV